METKSCETPSAGGLCSEIDDSVIAPRIWPKARTVCKLHGRLQSV